MPDHDSVGHSTEEAKASLQQYKHQKLSLSSHYKQHHPLREVSLTWPKLRHDVWTAACCSHCRSITHQAVHIDTWKRGHAKCDIFVLNHDEARVCQLLQLSAQALGRLTLLLCTDEYSSSNSKQIPDKTVNMAAKALSLSPSMTFPNWQTSIDIRIPPVAKRRMYRHSATMHSHKTPEGETEKEHHANVLFFLHFTDSEKFDMICKIFSLNLILCMRYQIGYQISVLFLPYSLL